MSGATAVEEVMDAREVLANIEFYGDVQVLLACKTIERHAYSHEVQAAEIVHKGLDRQIADPDGVDYVRAAAVLDNLVGQHREVQLAYLKTVCINKGVWSIPEDPDGYMPVWFEVTLFGVSALAETVEELPLNWCRAARRVLDAKQQEGSTQ